MRGCFVSCCYSLFIFIFIFIFKFNEGFDLQVWPRNVIREKKKKGSSVFLLRDSVQHMPFFFSSFYCKWHLTKKYWQTTPKIWLFICFYVFDTIWMGDSPFNFIQTGSWHTSGTWTLRKKAHSYFIFFKFTNCLLQTSFCMILTFPAILLSFP